MNYDNESKTNLKQNFIDDADEDKKPEFLKSPHYPNKDEVILEAEAPHADLLNDPQNEKKTNDQVIEKNDAENGEKVSTPKKKKCCFVELNEGVSYFNLCTYYLVQFSYVMAFTFIDSCQDYLLESDNYDYKVAKKDVGKVNGDILLFDTLYLIAFIYIYGSFHDIFGRKILVVYGFLSMALSLYLYPLAGKVYPNLILVRLIFSNGICAVTTQPLLADYVSHKTKGFGGGIAAVVSGLGAIFAALFLLKLQSYMSIDQVYTITAGLCVGVAIICIFGVKNIERRDDAEENVCKRL
jgi:hypothetical protein